MERIGSLSDLATILNAKFETNNLKEATPKAEAYAEACKK
jgi:hypothetical protein